MNSYNRSDHLYSMYKPQARQLSTVFVMAAGVPILCDLEDSRLRVNSLSGCLGLLSRVEVIFCSRHTVIIMQLIV